MEETCISLGKFSPAQSLFMNSSTCHGLYSDMVDRRSSNAMPREVREALAWCISIEGAGDLSIETATAYIEDMFESGRGGEESW